MIPPLIVILFLAEEAGRGWLELRGTRQKLIKAGAKLSPDEIVKSPIHETAAAVELTKAAESLEETRRIHESLRLMKMVAPGQALICFEQPTPVFERVSNGQADRPRQLGGS